VWRPAQPSRKIPDESNTEPIPAGPALVQQLEAINLKFDEAIQQARRYRARGALNSKRRSSDAGGDVSGREAIEGYVTDFFSGIFPPIESQK
jgi:hypothetical protein